MFNRKEWEKANKNKLKEYQRNYNETHREQRLANRRKRVEQLKLKAFDNYGGRFCSCCGESVVMFLTVDHIAGGGTKHRRSLGASGNSIYYWFEKNDYPTGYRVLCRNCNWGVYVNDGVCPHKEIDA